MGILIDAGADVKRAVDAAGRTPLHVACAAENGAGKPAPAAAAALQAVLRMLVRCGADVNAQDADGNTPLGVAVAHGCVRAISELIAMGADTTLANNDGQTPLHIAGRVGATTAVRSIMNYVWSEHSQKMLACDPNEPKPTPPNPNAQDKSGRTALHWAILNGHKETVRALVSMGCELRSPEDGDGKTCEALCKDTGLFSGEEVEGLEKLRVSEARSRDKGSPEYQERLRVVRARAVQLFGAKPMSGIQHMQKEGLLGTEPEDVAEFLLETPDLNKARIGDFIGGKTDFHKAVLRAFVKKMNFEGLEFDTALRRFLTAFRLPGEAQIIDRVMEAFAKHYYDQNSGTVFANEDAVYVLAFSAIMLNTDAHNPQVKDKMTKAQWLRQNQGVNDGADFPRDFLEGLYDRIVEDEIKMESGIFTNAEKKGWLTKQGGRIKTWKRRWFILSEMGLAYFKAPNDTEPCGIVMLDNVEVVPDKTRKNSFMLKVMDTSDDLNPIVNTKIKGAKMESGSMTQAHHSVYVFAAESQEDMESWIAAINSSIHHNPYYALVEQKKTSSDPAAKMSAHQGSLVSLEKPRL